MEHDEEVRDSSATRADEDSRDTRESNDLPEWAVWLIDVLAGQRHRDDVVGDFAQTFRYVASTDGRPAAIRWYGYQVVRSLPAFVLHGTQTNGTMLKSYLIAAIRSLKKRAFFSAINIGGLALGMAACLLIFQYVAFEYSFDRFHENSDSLYRVVLGQKRGGADTDFEAYTWHKLGPAIAEQVPEVSGVARFHPTGSLAYVARLDGDSRTITHSERMLAYADPSLLSLFSFPIVNGDVTAALAEPGSVVLTASTAQKYFPSENPIGQSLDIRSWTDGTYTVTAVVDDVPANSHLQFDLLLPMTDLLSDPHGQYFETDGWSWSNFVTYVELIDSADPKVVASKIDSVVVRAKGEDYAANNIASAMTLQRITDVHLFTWFEDADYSGRGYRTVYFFGIVALFILVIAWVNYLNLATARASERAREIGIRKASGARRGQVVTQFLTEAAVINSVALLLSLGIAWLALPFVNDFAGAGIDASVWKRPSLWIMIFAVFGGGTLLVSLYPALLLSAFAPAVVLKGRGGASSGRDPLRRVLVAIQFVASLTLLIGTYIVYSQVNYLRRLDIGVDVDQVLVVRRPGFIDDADAYSEARKTFATELQSVPGIGSVASSTTVPGGGFSLGTRGRMAGRDPDQAVTMRMTWVSDKFAETYGLTFVAGRSFANDFGGDEDRAVMINETAVRAFGFASADDAVGSEITIGGSSNREVVGVFEDVHWTSAKQEEEPTVLGLTGGGAYFSVRARTNDLSGLVSSVSEKYEAVFPGNAFDYFFADRFFDAQYEADRQFGALFGLFAAMALVIACLGLVGLAAYTVAQRTKEIGIRKVLGASPIGVARLLLTDVVRLVAIALVVSVPVLWYVGSRWLESFATHIDLRPGTFLLPACLLLLVALATVTYHTLRIARTDPVRALRYE